MLIKIPEIHLCMICSFMQIIHLLCYSSKEVKLYKKVDNFIDVRLQTIHLGWSILQICACNTIQCHKFRIIDKLSKTENFNKKDQWCLIPEKKMEWEMAYIVSALPKIALAKGKKLCCNTHLYTCWFMVLSSTPSHPYHARWTNITICSLHADIYVPLTLAPTHPSSSICVMSLQSWLVIGDTMSPVADVQNKMRSSESSASFPVGINSRQFTSLISDTLVPYKTHKIQNTHKYKIE